MPDEFQHPFLSPEHYERLKTLVELLRVEGKMTPMVDDGEIMLAMVMNGVTMQPMNAGDNHQVALFSDENWCYIVIKYANFEQGDNGYGAVKLDRTYMMSQLCPLGTFNHVLAKKLTDSLLCFLLVDPRKVEVDMSTMNGNRNGRIIV